METQKGEVNPVEHTRFNPQKSRTGEASPTYTTEPTEPRTVNQVYIHNI